MLVGKLLKVAEPGVAKLERDLVAARAEVARLRRDAAIRTPRTRIAWSDLRGWLDGWKAIERRRTSAQRYEALHAHLALLTVEHVESAGAAELDELERVLAHGHNVLPPKGKRAGHHTTRLRDAIDRARTRLRGDRAEVILEAAIAVMRERLPVGVDRGYFEGFVGRNRGVLLNIVRRLQV